ncbi:hypothetical protein KJK32_16735 [Streptomyces sp. JCM17656]|nr:hypothetical protein KJK32_16735 [Streptomyces sp. JCM17656]
MGHSTLAHRTLGRRVGDGDGGRGGRGGAEQVIGVLPPALVRLARSAAGQLVEFGPVLGRRDDDLRDLARRHPVHDQGASGVVENLDRARTGGRHVLGRDLVVPPHQVGDLSLVGLHGDLEAGLHDELWFFEHILRRPQRRGDHVARHGAREFDDLQQHVTGLTDRRVAASLARVQFGDLVGVRDDAGHGRAHRDLVVVRLDLQVGVPRLACLGDAQQRLGHGEHLLGGVGDPVDRRASGPTGFVPRAQPRQRERAAVEVDHPHEHVDHAELTRDRDVHQVRLARALAAGEHGGQLPDARRRLAAVLVAADLQTVVQRAGRVVVGVHGRAGRDLVLGLDVREERAAVGALDDLDRAAVRQSCVAR